MNVSIGQNAPMNTANRPLAERVAPVVTSETASASAASLEDHVSLHSADSPECSNSSANVPAAKRKWTALLYMDGNNSDIEDHVFNSFLGLEEVADHENIAIAAELGRIPKNSTPVPGEAENSHLQPWNSVRRYEVCKGEPAAIPVSVDYCGVAKHDGKIDSKLVEDFGQADMSDPKRLEDFLAWGMQKYPAEHYMVVLGNHGGGITGILRDQRADRNIKMPALSQALDNVAERTGQRPDLLVMDACLMGQAEVVGELSDNTSWYVASQDLNWNSYPMESALGKAEAAWDAGQDVSPEKMGEYIVSSCSEHSGAFPTSALVNTRLFAQCKEAVSELATSLMKTSESPHVIRSLVRKAPAASLAEKGKPYTDYRDLGALAKSLTNPKKIKDPAVREAAQKVLDALGNGMVRQNAYTERKEGELCGLNIYFPLDGYKMGKLFGNGAQSERLESIYGSLEFVRETGWNSVIEKYAGILPL